jgi:TatD DNase family protein
MKNIFDSHSHYTDRAFNDDREQLLSTLPEKGICGVIACASNIKDSRQTVSLAESFPYIYASIGIHPLDEKTVKDGFSQAEIELTTLADLKADCKKVCAKVCAIGEIGLDYHYDGSNRERQSELVEMQLELANKLNLPVIVHSREATKDCMDLLKKFRPKGVVHCFSGSAETAKEVLDLGMYIGFTGVITFPNSKKAREALEVVPSDRLLVETDCPYMSPVPERGKRCDSALLKYTIAKIAEIKGLEPQKTADITAENAKKIFGIMP